MSERRREHFRKSTINDVAALAGVSIKTVSRVLNREPKVRPTTRDRVEAAMQELRYRPNSPGRMLASRRSYILGLVYNANSSYITSIQNGALDACRLQQLELRRHHPHERCERELRDQHAQRAGGRGHEQRLDQQLPHEPARRCTEGAPRQNFALASRGCRQQESRDVEYPDHEERHDTRKQQRQSSPGAVRHALGAELGHR